MSAARSCACSCAFALRSSKSTLPSSSHLTTTTRMPAITALAALVPCADSGMRHTVRAPLPRLSWEALMGMSATQFQQVALLPQGEFQTFLRATSQERRDVLEQLFRTDRFSRIEDWVHGRSRDLSRR